MERVDGRIIVSASDLVAYLACPHVTTLDAEAASGLRPRPAGDDPELEVLRRRGFEHEKAYLGELGDAGLAVVEIPDDHGGPATGRIEALHRAERRTVAAMEAAADVVYQATFLDERGGVLWRGHADFLRRVPGPTALGAYGYEPVDTKLARHVRPSAVLQLCSYAEQVERLQGAAPDRVHVVLGGRREETIRLAEVAAYYRASRARFLAALGEHAPTYPVPVEHCAVCPWLPACEERWEADDHLCRVAGLGREQVRKLTAAGIPTLSALAASAPGLRVPGMTDTTVARLRTQARLQHARHPGEPPPFELVEGVEPGRGLSALPPPDPGDVFYDIEGDPFVGDAGIEYLHGVGWLDGGSFTFRAFWGHTPAEERRAFEGLIDLLVERRRRFPGMHVYHYANYEPHALGKLMGRYGTREDELDDLLRGQVFVDLYRVVRQGLVIGSSSYSLKKLEPLYMPARSEAITDAASSIVEYERWLQTGDDRILAEIEAYNRTDVESTRLLRDWLEARRADLVSSGRTVARPEVGAVEPSPAPSSDEADGDPDGLVARLLDGRVDPPEADAPAGERARWLMAQLLAWHQREAKPEWWRYFDRVLQCDESDLLRDSECIAGLEPAGPPAPGERESRIWTYRFDPDQEHKLRAGSPVLDPATERVRQTRPPDAAPRLDGPGRLVELDATLGILRLQRPGSSRAVHPRSLIPGRPIPTHLQRDALRAVARALLDHGVDGPGPFAAARLLLGRFPPRVRGSAEGSALRCPGEEAPAAAVRIASALDRSYLAVQGPPGAGKTWTAARMVVALVRAGSKVGITASSHAVISHLLERVVDAGEEQGVRILAVQKVSNPDEGYRGHPHVEVTEDNAKVAARLRDGGFDVVAGTSWLFAREAMRGAVDTLVVDEAGQLSLANVLSVTPAASGNLILVGDPRQLAQPSKGHHPEGAEVSALEHVLGRHATVPEHLGLFLDRTWRLHPAICAFVSEQVYDGRLQARSECAHQAVDDGPVLGGSGLRWVPVEHHGNRTSSDEEAVAVHHLVTALVGRTWTDHDGVRRPLGLDDILVVAPYNAQVNRLTATLPRGARIGTVDKFQGQEAAVVIVSLASSTADDAPRGMEFLYSRNRLNVAVSRARALAVMVGSPALLAVRCRTVEQMRLANVLCRFVEMAMPVGL